MNIRTIAVYVVSIGVTLAIGFAGSISTMSSITGWYAELVRPSWTPSNWVFGPVWTTLYLLMGVSAALVWNSNKAGKGKVLAFYAVHLIVNFAWSYVFFGLHNTAVALAIIALLWVMIVTMMVWFYRFSRTATYLLVPYLVWVTYASTLNLGILILNP